MVGKILSINGNQSMNYLLKTILGSAYNLLAVQDAYEAMQVLKAVKEIDCALIDTDYHTIQNIDFIQHLKNSYLYQCPVIILASKKEPDEDLEPSSVTKVFFKPFNPLVLKQSIDEIMTLSLI